MSTLQFSLFFAAIAVGYLVVHLRVVRFERYLAELTGLKRLNEQLGERVKAMTGALERLHVEGLEDRLDRLHDDLLALHHAVERLEGTVHRDLSQPAPTTPAVERLREERRGSPGEVVRAAIETRLLALGYGDIRVLSDLSDVRLDEQFEAIVECQRQFMPHKGAVVVRNGGVVDVRLSSAVQAFP